MNVTKHELMARARHSLTGHYPTAAGAVLLLFIIMRGLDFFFGGAFGTLLFSVISLLLSFLSGLLMVGVIFICLSLARSRKVGLRDLFYAFRSRPDRTVVLTALLTGINALILVPAVMILLFVLPVLGVSIHILPGLTFILPELSGMPRPAAPAGTAISAIVLICWLLALFFILFAVNARYALIYLLCMDESQLSAIALIKKSSRMLHGYRRQFASLLLSLFGYVILGLLSYGIGLLWIIPCLYTTLAHFYLNLRQTSDV